MKIIGIGGAGSKIATVWDPTATIVNVSEVEMGKLSSGEKILATLRDGKGLVRGSRMDPHLGYLAYSSVQPQLCNLAKGAFIFTATGGGSGSGITKGLLEDIARGESGDIKDRTLFGLVLPYARLEGEQFVSNTSAFLNESVAPAIDSGTTGNIFMFSNRDKYEKRISESDFNRQIIDSLREFFAIPEKNERFRLLDEHIDEEDFAYYLAKPYFNHFCCFDYDPEQDFGKQLSSHYNTLLLPPEQPIEALFLMEIPAGGDPTVFYNLMEYFNAQGVKPMYSVVENPGIGMPHVTVSLLYSRKPKELVDDFNKIAEEHVQTKVGKTLEQFVPLQRLEVNIDNEARKAKPEMQDDIIGMLKRLNKI